MSSKPFVSGMTTTHTSRRHVLRGRGCQNLIERLESRIVLSASLVDAGSALALVASSAVPALAVSPAISTPDLTLQGNSTAIANDETNPMLTNFTDFGGTAADGTVPLTRSYTMTNNTSGTIDLTGNPLVAISGADAGDFAVTTEPGPAIAASGSTTFVITFTPTAAGLRTATVTIASNDSQIPSYIFDIQGTALAATTEAGGLEIDTTTAGAGAMAQDGELLDMDYSGYLTNGTEFDSNTNPTFGHVEPFEFNLGAGSVIKGWDEGLVGMQVGESRTLIVPASLGYGSSGQGTIPANATLIFTTTLLNIVSLASSSDVFIADGDTSPITTDGTNFGQYTDSDPAVTETFVVNAAGGGLSSLLASPQITLAGAGASTFSVTQPTFNAGNTQGTFTVTYTPSPGISTATVTINNAESANGDPNLTFDVQGQGEEEATGVVSTANWDEVTGWAYDPVNPTASINVEIVIAGGPTTPQVISADQTLNSLQNLIGSTNHGFTYATPCLTVGAHAVSVYAVDTTTGHHDLIGTGTIVSQNSLFDEHYYLEMNPDVAAAVTAGAFATGYDHYLAYGQYEGRSPSPYWDEAWYLQENPDVAAAVKAHRISSGFMHYYLYGQYENRGGVLYFNTSYYLTNNPDVAAAVTAGS
ncbi:MAG: FKBP-type peptidyl-prolyl cis-trans isomerase, partial [Tepidisphaeraceae bacterium]